MRRNRGYGQRRRSRGHRGRLNVGRMDLRTAAIIIVAFVAGAVLLKMGVINPLGGLLR